MDLYGAFDRRQAAFLRSRLFLRAAILQRDPDGGYKSFVFTDSLSAEEIAELRGWVESEVRRKLGIPFNLTRAAQRFEHSMGQGLPGSIIKRRPRTLAPNFETAILS